MASAHNQTALPLLRPNSHRDDARLPLTEAAAGASGDHRTELSESAEEALPRLRTVLLPRLRSVAHPWRRRWRANLMQRKSLAKAASGALAKANANDAHHATNAASIEFSLVVFCNRHHSICLPLQSGANQQACMANCFCPRNQDAPA